MCYFSLSESYFCAFFCFLFCSAVVPGVCPKVISRFFFCQVVVGFFFPTGGRQCFVFPEGGVPCCRGWEGVGPNVACRFLFFRRVVRILLVGVLFFGRGFVRMLLVGVLFCRGLGVGWVLPFLCFLARPGDWSSCNLSWAVWCVGAPPPRARSGRVCVWRWQEHFLHDVHRACAVRSEGEVREVTSTEAWWTHVSPQTCQGGAISPTGSCKLLGELLFLGYFLGEIRKATFLLL